MKKSRGNKLNEVKNGRSYANRGIFILSGAALLDIDFEDAGFDIAFVMGFTVWVKVG